MKILIYSVLAGIAAGAITYFIADSIVKPKPGSSVGGSYAHGDYKFVWYFTAFVGGAAFLIVRGVLGHFANKAWVKNNLEGPEARLVRDKKPD